MKLEAFIITNRRSTFPKCVSSIVNQRVQIPITIIQGKGWLEALNECLDRCKSSYFVRIDDDFILHPDALMYMWHQVRSIENKPKMGLYLCYLWETWTKKPVRGIKIYNKTALENIGGFHSDEFGKVDKFTNQAFENDGYNLIIDKSIVGIHACSSLEDQKRYEELWSGQAKNPYIKSTHKAMIRYAKKGRIVEQWNMAKTPFLLSRNTTTKRGQTGFGRMLGNS